MKFDVREKPGMGQSNDDPNMEKSDRDFEKKCPGNCPGPRKERLKREIVIHTDPILLGKLEFGNGQLTL